jgi:hypothetical protein
MRRNDDPAWPHYPDTVLEFFRRPDDGEAALRVDLRRPVGDDVRERLAELGLDGPFGIVTAAAPRGQPQDDDFDRARQGELDEVARAEAGFDMPRVDGVSPDGEHRERSVVVRMPKADVVELGRRYQQSAVFWFDGADFWLLGAEVAAEPQRLPADAESREPTAGSRPS